MDPRVAALESQVYSLRMKVEAMEWRFAAMERQKHERYMNRLLFAGFVLVTVLLCFAMSIGFEGL